MRVTLAPFIIAWETAFCEIKKCERHGRRPAAWYQVFLDTKGKNNLIFKRCAPVYNIRKAQFWGSAEKKKKFTKTKKFKNEEEIT